MMYIYIIDGVITMKRTQLYLDEKISEKLAEISKKEKRTISQLVRDALEIVYLKESKPDMLEALQKCRGIWADRKGFNAYKFIRQLRKDTRRMRFGKGIE